MTIPPWLLVVLVFGADAATPAPPAPAPDAPVPPTVRPTLWPRVLPCTRPVELTFDQRVGGDIVWSDDDGGASLTFSPKTKQPIRLARGFPMGRLTTVTRDQFSVSPRDSRDGFHAWLQISCPRGAEIEWGGCDAQGCSVSATYPSGPLPRATRMSRWVHPLRSPWADEAPELHYSLFHKQIGDRKSEEDGVARASLRFTRDAAADLRELIALACRGGRCTPPVAAVDAALAAFLADKAPRYARVRHSEEVSHWSVDWEWTATAGGTTLRALCWDQVDSPVLGCYLALHLPGEIWAVYHPRTEYGAFEHDLAFYREVDAKHERPLGTIDLMDGETSYPWPRIDIAGLPLALRPAAPATIDRKPTP